MFQKWQHQQGQPGEAILVVLPLLLCRPSNILGFMGHLRTLSKAQSRGVDGWKYYKLRGSRSRRSSGKKGKKELENGFFFFFLLPVNFLSSLSFLSRHYNPPGFQGLNSPVYSNLPSRPPVLVHSFANFPCPGLHEILLIVVHMYAAIY